MKWPLLCCLYLSVSPSVCLSVCNAVFRIVRHHKYCVCNAVCCCVSTGRREKQYLDEREAMQREHIANEQKYSQAVRELQAKVSY